MPGGIHPPVATILSWGTNQYPHGERRGQELFIGIIVMFIVTVLVVAARLYARVLVQRNPGLDDALIVATMVPTTGMAVAIALADRKFGFDRHVWDLTPEMGVQSRQVTMAASALYIVSTALTKISILCFYRRLGEGTISKWFLYAVRGSIFFVLGYMITFLLTLFFGCRPVHAFWDSVNPTWYIENQGKFHCFDEGADYVAAGIISVIQDFITCLLPLMITWTLQIPKRQKIALMGIFCVGFFLCIIGILRLHHVYSVYYRTYDVTWAAYPGWAWTAAEAHLAIICASAPALKLFFRGILQATGYSSGTKRGTSGYYRNTGNGAISGGKHGTNTNTNTSRSHVCKDGCSEIHEIALRDMRAKEQAGSGSSSDEENEIQSPSFRPPGTTSQAAIYSTNKTPGGGAMSKQQSEQPGAPEFGIQVTNEVDVVVSQALSKGGSKSSREELL